MTEFRPPPPIEKTWMLKAEIMMPCLSGKDCRLDWTAIAAIGGWFAAVATFLAVLLPFRSQQKDRKARARVAAGDVAVALQDMGRRISNALSLVISKGEAGEWYKKWEWETLRLPPLVVSLDATSDTEQFLLNLNAFVKAQRIFSELVEGFTSESDEMSSLNYLVGNSILRHRLLAVELAFEKMRTELDAIGR